MSYTRKQPLKWYNFNTSPTARYLNEISNLEILSWDDQKEKIFAAQNGDLEARNEVITSNLRLVRSIAAKYWSFAKYSRNGVEFADVIHEGVFGVYKAMDKFEIDRGFRFSTYVHYWIKHAIGRAYDEDRFSANPVRAPFHIKELMKAIYKFDTQMYVIEGRHSTKEELFDELKEFHVLKRYSEETKKGMIETAILTRSSLSFSRSLQAQVFGENLKGDGGADLSEILPTAQDPFNRIERANLEEFIDHCLDQLRIDPLQRAIFGYRKGLNGKGEYTLQEIGNMVDITRQGVHQIESKVTKLLKRHLEIHYPYLQDEFEILNSANQ